MVNGKVVELLLYSCTVVQVYRCTAIHSVVHAYSSVCSWGERSHSAEGALQPGPSLLLSPSFCFLALWFFFIYSKYKEIALLRRSHRSNPPPGSPNPNPSTRISKPETPPLNPEPETPKQVLQARRAFHRGVRVGGRLLPAFFGLRSVPVIPHWQFMNNYLAEM